MLRIDAMIELVLSVLMLILLLVRVSKNNLWEMIFRTVHFQHETDTLIRRGSYLIHYLLSSTIVIK